MGKIVGLISNANKDENFAVTKRLISYLLMQGCTPIVPQNIAVDPVLAEHACPEEELFEKSDFIISLGGDGTLLGVARKAARYDTPILGINLGTLGFLTAEEKNKAEQTIDKVLKGDYVIEKRSMLTTSMTMEDGRIDGVIALNDICINRGSLYKILEYNLFVNNEFVDTLRADGVVICTPTGSTAYNLSAGGPVLKADAEMFAITPVAAHTLTSRSIVVSANDTITVEINPKGDTEFVISTDGQETWTFTGKKVIQIKKAPFYTTIIKTNAQSFYDVLRQKLSR